MVLDAWQSLFANRCPLAGRQPLFAARLLLASF